MLQNNAPLISALRGQGAFKWLRKPGPMNSQIGRSAGGAVAPARPTRSMAGLLAVDDATQRVGVQDAHVPLLDLDNLFVDKL